MSGLYLHIPFCHKKCAYCDFYSTVSTQKIDEYIAALLDEWNIRKDSLRGAIDTIYIGGGTPSILSPDRILRLLDALPVESASEITIEMNPENVTPQFVKLLLNYGVNRFSMGVQSLRDKELKLLGRRHNSADALRAAEILMSMCANVSLDVMFGIPGQTLPSWSDTVKGIISLLPHHISAYSLMLEHGTLMYRQIYRGDVSLPSQESNHEMYALLCQELRDAGYSHYEISNFAREGFRSRHNSAYWNLTEYLGIGASAHSFNGLNERSANPAKLSDYMSRRSATATVERLSEKEMIEEAVMLGLRTSAGLDLRSFRERFGADAALHLERSALQGISGGNLSRSGDIITIPEHRWLIADNIIVSLFP